MALLIFFPYVLFCTNNFIILNVWYMLDYVWNKFVADSTGQSPYKVARKQQSIIKTVYLESIIKDCGVVAGQLSKRGSNSGFKYYNNESGEANPKISSKF